MTSEGEILNTMNLRKGTIVKYEPLDDCQVESARGTIESLTQEKQSLMIETSPSGIIPPTIALRSIKDLRVDDGGIVYVYIELDKFCYALAEKGRDVPRTISI